MKNTNSTNRINSNHVLLIDLFRAAASEQTGTQETVLKEPCSSSSLTWVSTSSSVQRSLTAFKFYHYPPTPDVKIDAEVTLFLKIPDLTSFLVSSQWQEGICCIFYRWDFLLYRNSKSRYLIRFVRTVALKTRKFDDFPELHSSINFKESGHFMEK